MCAASNMAFLYSSLISCFPDNIIIIIIIIIIFNIYFFVIFDIQLGC